MEKDEEKPRIYADFNKWDGDENSRWLVLTCKGTSEDMVKLGIQFAEGLAATFYMDDADDEGNYDEIEVDGFMHYDATKAEWNGIIDWNSVRHVSDGA